MEQAVRDEFEAAYPLPDGMERNGESYTGGEMWWLWEERWQVWQRSRAALRVEDEIDRLKAENEALRGALQAVVDDPTWRSNDNTLWPKIIKAMDKGATQ